MDNNLDKYIKETFGYVEFTEEQRKVIEKTMGFATHELNRCLLNIFCDIKEDFEKLITPITKEIKKQKDKTYKKKNKEVKNWERNKFYQR